MALIVEVGPGITPPLKHSRTWYKTTRQTQTSIRKFKRKRVPIRKNPTSQEAAIWGTRHVIKARKLLGFIAGKWAAGAAPWGQAWWDTLASANPIINYKGKPKTLTGKQFWMWFYKEYANYAGENWYAHWPAWDFTVYPPILPWTPPPAPTFDSITATSPFTLEFYYTQADLGYQFFPICYLRIKASNPNAPRANTQYESNVNAGWLFGVDPNPIGNKLDLSPFEIKPGTRARVGLRLLDVIKQQPSDATWQDIIFD